MSSLPYRKLSERDDELTSLKSECDKLKAENESLKARGRNTC